MATDDPGLSRRDLLRGRVLRRVVDDATKPIDAVVRKMGEGPSGNTCDGESFYGAKGEGGVGLSFATATLTDCLIRDNSTTGADGGGGVASSAGDVSWRSPGERGR